MPWRCTIERDETGAPHVNGELLLPPAGHGVPEGVARALATTNATITTLLASRLLQKYRAFLLKLLAMRCDQPGRPSCSRPVRCQQIHGPTLAHDVIVLNSDGGSGTTRSQELFELFTTRSTQSDFKEPGRFRRAWGSPRDNSVYVTVQPGSCAPANPTCSGEWQLSHVNITVRKPYDNETALVKSHRLDFGCNVQEPEHGCYVARTVHLLRNPIDNIIALFKIRVVTKSREWQQALTARRQRIADHLLQHWRSFAVQGVRDFVDWHVRTLHSYRARRIMFVHYEELSAFPDVAMERMLHFAGVQPAPGTLEMARERALRTARPPPHPDFALGLPWDSVRMPLLVDEQTATLIADEFEAAVANVSALQIELAAAASSRAQGSHSLG